MKTNILSSYCIGFDKVMSRTFLRLDSLSVLSRQSVLAIFVACLTVLGVGNAWGVDVTFTFNSDAGIAALGISKPSTGNGTNLDTSNPYVLSGVSMAVTNGSTNTRVWNSSGTLELRVYSSAGSLTFTAPGNITDVLISGTTVDGFSANVGTYNTGTGAWSGDAASVTFTAGATQKVNTIKVTYTASDPYTVNFNAQGGTCGTASLTEASGGAGVTLPAASPTAACASEGWAFYGWATARCASSTSTAPTIVGKAGDTYHPLADNTTLHAVYAQGEYTKETSSITSGAKYLIVANSTKNYIMTDQYSLDDDEGQMASVQIDETSSNKYHVAAVNANWCYTIEGTAGHYHIRDVKNSSDANYIDIAYQDWYGKGVDPDDQFTITVSSSNWTLQGNWNHSKGWAYEDLAFDGSDKVFIRGSGTVLLYKETTTPAYWSNPSCCANEVSVSESGSSHITSMAFSESSVATCGDAASRTITITVTPASGYSLFGSTKPVFTKTSGTVTATIGSVTDNGDGTFSYECTFNSNDNGAGTFAISPGQFTNYRTLCCAEHDITLASSGSKTGGSFEVDPAKACEGTEITLMADADAGYDFSGWTVTNDDDDDDDVTTMVLGSGNEDDEIVAFDMPAYNITIDAAFTPQTYSITYYDGDEEDDNKTFSGTHETGYPTSHTYASATTLMSATKSGFNFGGWYDNKECEGDPITSLGATDYTADVVLYAKWIDDSKWTVTIGSHANGSISVTYTGMESPLTSGSREIEKNTKLTISATPNTGYTLTNLTVGDDDDFTSGGTHTLIGNITVSATFSAINYTITYNLNDGVNNGDNVASYTIKDEVYLYAASRTGYHFDGWFTDAEFDPESEILGIEEGSTGNVVVYAKWSANSYDVTLKPNGGTGSDQVVSATYDATMPITVKTAGTDIVIPTREGYTFTGWWDATSGGNKYYNADGTSARTWNVAEATNLYAQWSVNDYNVAVSAVGDVTISATSPSVAEGSSADAAYGSTVSLSYSGVASGKTWGGWNVYKTDDASTTVTVTSNQFTMPAYNVTVSAIIYGDAIAWCDPEIEVTGNDVYLTSYKDISVFTTSAADNLLTIHSDDMGSATKMEVAYLDADNADAEVDKAESVFRLYNAAGLSTVDELDLDYEWETNHSIRYTPSEYGVTNNYKLKLMFKRGDKVLKTVTHAIYGRSLPEEFVIACKYNDEWYALPNTMGTSGEDVTPLKITVNNTTTPTAATYAPTTAVYKGAARHRAGNNLNSIRLTKNGSQWLTTSATMEMSLSETAAPTAGVEGKQVWHLKSADFGAYTLQMDPAQSNTKKLGIYDGKIGLCVTPAGTSGAIYLLPITNKYTEIAATVSEWGEHGVIVHPSTPSDLTGVASATMNIDAALPSAATTSAVNAAIGTAKRVKVDGGALTVGAVANDGKLLYIHWKNSGGSEIGVSQIQIPYVVAADGAMKTLIGAKDTWAKKEVHVLPGVTLTADAGNFGSSAVTVPTMHIYPGATLNVSTGTLTATTLRLHNGWTRAGEKAYDVARVYIADNAALTKGTASMDYDIYELTDGKHYYPLAVPFPVAVEDIDYADETLAYYSNYGMTGQYVIKTYDGEQRAARGGHDENWIDVPLKDEKEADVYLEPGKGYIITAISVKGEAIIRVPLDYNDAWTADGEKATAHYDDADHTKNVVAVTAWTGEASNSKKLHAGWNLLGLPYMSCYKTSDGTSGMETTAAVLTGKVNFSTTPISFEDDGFKYVSVPVHDFSEYIQAKITDANTKLLPGWCFFVQIGTSGNLTFLSADQMASSSLPIYAPKRENSPVIETGIVLSNGEKSDNTTLIISDRYSAAEYEINADLEKMFGNAFTLSTYSMIGDAKFAYNALSTEDARQAIPLGVRIPADGEYTFTLNPQYAEADIERLDLIDYVAGEITNLMTDSYTFTMTQGENTERFALNVTMRQETPTDIEEVQGDDVQGTKVRKMIINDKLYILRGGVMYDATGKKVGEVNRNK